MHAWRACPRSPVFEESLVGGAADRGSAVHALLLGGRAIEVVEADDWRTAAARQARDEARAKDRIPILAKEMAGLSAMVDPIRERLSALHGGAFLTEQTAIWRSFPGGWRRARIDTVSTDRCLIVDYKTTEALVDASSCERRIADMGLQMQAAAYVEAVETLHPELQGRVRFIFQWQEQKAPYALSPSSPAPITASTPSNGSRSSSARGRAEPRRRCGARVGEFPKTSTSFAGGRRESFRTGRNTPASGHSVSCGGTAGNRGEFNRSAQHIL
jgi:hypothetical protein